MKRALWTVNALLAAGIVTFTARTLVFPPKMARLADIDPAASLPSPPPRPGEQPGEQALITLRNPLRTGETPGAPTLPSLVLHGALPTLRGHEGVAFVRTDSNASKVVPIGEEIQGWRLTELWKDRAAFTNARGEWTVLEIRPAR